VGDTAGLAGVRLTGPSRLESRLAVRNARSLPSWRPPSPAFASAPGHSEEMDDSSGRGRTAAQTGISTYSNPVTSARRVTPLTFMT
jgi:hypothetical protein